MKMFINNMNSLINYCLCKVKYGNAIHSDEILRLKRSTKILIDNGSKMFFGKRVSFFDDVHLTAVAGGFLSVDDDCFFNRHCLLICRNRIDIGTNCIFGPNVTVYDHDHKFGYDGIVKNEFKVGEVVIENDCWIGANVTILRDTHIGHHSVIGAGCLVKGSIPPHSLVTSDRELKIIPINRR